MAILSSRQTYRNPSTSPPTPQTLNPKMNPTSTASEKQVYQQHLDIKHNPHHRNQRNDAEDALIPACMDAEGSQLGQYGPIASFDDMGLPTAILRGIYACGYEDPSVIQQLVKSPSCPAPLRVTTPTATALLRHAPLPSATVAGYQSGCLT